MVGVGSSKLKLGFYKEVLFLINESKERNKMLMIPKIYMKYKINIDKKH